MGTVVAQGKNGTAVPYDSYDIVPIPDIPGVGGGLGFNPTDAGAWSQAVAQAPNGVGGTGNVGAFSFTANGGGPMTFTITVRPFASLIDTVPGTLYVYTRDAGGNPTVLTFPVGGSGLTPQTYSITYGDTGTQTYQGQIDFAIVPSVPALGMALTGGAKLLDSLGVLSKNARFGTSGALPSAGYNVQVFTPSVGPRSENDSFNSTSLDPNFPSADDEIVTGSVTKTDVQTSTGASIADEYTDNALNAEFFKDESGKNSALIYNAQTTQDVAVWTSGIFDVNTDLQGQPHLTIVASQLTDEVNFSTDPKVKMEYGSLDTQSDSDQTTVQNVQSIAGSSNDEISLYNVYKVKGSTGDDVFDVDLTGISNTPLDIDGNGGNDILNIQVAPSGTPGNLSLTTTSNSSGGITVTGNGFSANVSSVETINLAGDNNTLFLKPTDSPTNTTINLGATTPSSNDTLDFSQYGNSVYLGSTKSAEGSGQAIGLFGSANMTAFTGLSFAGVTDLMLGAGNDTIDISGGADPYLKTINTGDGNDTVSVSGSGVTVNFGSGNDTLKSSGPGTIVKTGTGADKIEASHNGQLLVEDASTDDRITYYGNTLTGGVHWGGSESVYAYGIHGERYGRNKQGNLVIVDDNGNETFIPRFNFGTDGTDRTAGIEVLDISFKLARSNMWTSSFETAAAILCAEEKAGEALYGWPPSGMKDPLVLDLNGDGISLSAEEGSGVSFDINNNGFAAPVGWVNADDGFLVRDLNGNGKIDNDGEMFGGPSASGFSQLALLDGNGDGKVDASDNGLVDFNGDGVVDSSDTFDSLKIWVDANQNGVTDAGELHSLSDFNIVSIAVGSTPSAKLGPIRANRRDWSFSTRRGVRSMKPKCRSKTGSSIPPWAWPLSSRSRPVRAGSSNICCSSGKLAGALICDRMPQQHSTETSCFANSRGRYALSFKAFGESSGTRHVCDSNLRLLVTERALW
jgi:hypothetical protein